ncbi:MAG: T9SS type A sorting domain-containing protein [Chitinophagales bacterium]|nr:T9SS type A sorting domain-containing protein [Chitinophagales bacterium]
MRKYTLLLLFIGLSLVSFSATVSSLNGFYRNGQVFLTWQNISGSEAYYKVYRSTSPITTSSQLGNAEYLGWVNKSGSKDHNLSEHDGMDRYIRLDSAGTPLNSSTNLFVATTLVNGSYYYAVTSTLNGVETKTLSNGNKLQNPINEVVAKPQPVFQEQRTENNKSFKIYVSFFSTKREINQGPINMAGFISFDLALYLNNATGKRPLNVRLHPGGNDFFWTITTTKKDEINLNIEDRTPGSEYVANWGANENYNIYKSNEENTVPSSGKNWNFFQLRIKESMDWAISHLPVDSNRVYMEGSSNGAPGVYFFAITYPEKLAAVKATVGCFNFSFQNDYNPNCSLNPGKPNRVDGNKLFGTVTDNLMTNLGIGVYDALNGGWIINKYNDKDYPVIYSMNGKNDATMGWTEKPIYYDAVNVNKVGGYYFFDPREHSGDGKIWSNDNFDLFRYRKDLSYPAFSNCSLNEDYGNGTGTSGADFGSVNGMLDWKNEVTEDAQSWEAKVFIRNLKKDNGDLVVYPDNGTADITLRRLQKFKPTSGSTITWSVSHNNQVIDNGSFTYQGGLVTIPNVKIYKDTSVVHLSTSGGSNPCTATITPQGNLNICQTGSVVLKANGSTGFKYQWKKGTTNIAGATKKSYTAIASGTYKVVVTNTNGCKATSAGTKVTSSCKEDLLEYNMNDALNLYPNPAENYFTIDMKLKAEDNGEAIIQVINMLGQVIYAEKATVIDGTLKTIINIDNINKAGMYHVNVIVNDNLYSRQFLHQ